MEARLKDRDGESLGAVDEESYVSKPVYDGPC
jgi:hypothetical protein